MIDDSIDRGRRRRGVERAEHEVPGLGRLNRNRHRLEVAHLAHQNDVRILAQRRTQRVLERHRVVVHFALVDRTRLVFVHELDRILDRDDVILPVAVDVVDHPAERGRLAGAGRSGDEHQPLVQPAKIENRGRQAQRLGGQDVARNHAEEGAATFAVHEDVGAESSQVEDVVREIRVVALGEIVI